MNKLESLRAAAALYLKLETFATELQSWKIAPPLGGLLDQIERYFSKVQESWELLVYIEHSKIFGISQNIHKNNQGSGSWYVDEARDRYH